MMYDLYMFDHGVLHIHFWTLPAILVALIMLIMILVHNHKQKKREKDFEKEMEEAGLPIPEVG